MMGRILALLVASAAAWLACPRPAARARRRRSFATAEGREFCRLMERRP
jgi:hypothetical protein